jgi:UDP-4-amino-4,6-dideoxy-N-acetyl-beta-L-altrosamine transaminase
MIPYGRQQIDQADIDAVVEVLQSSFITQGPAIPRFEKAIAEHVAAKHGVAVNSGTAALHLACKALGLGSGDVLWTTPITFVASANCALYCGASVDFVDIDPRTYNISVERLAEKLERAKECGKLPSILVAVHLTGQPCEMAAIANLARKYNFRVIEDASHALGGKYQNEPIGNCRHSDITTFSFHPVKLITTGEGGLATTNDDELAWQMQTLRTHGITRDIDRMTHDSDGPWYYQQLDLGFNYRITDLQAALGLSQLRHLNDWVQKRHEIAKRYNDLLADLPITCPWQHPDSYSGWHLYVIRLKLDELHVSHSQVFERLRGAGIGVNLHYIPIYHQPYYQKLGHPYESFPQADAYYAEAISIPMFPGLSIEQQDTVVSALTKALTP